MRSQPAAAASSKKCRHRRRAAPRPSSNKCRDRRPAEPRPHLAWLLAGLGVLAAAGSMLTPAGPAAATAVNVGAAPLEPATTGGLATLDRALAKLATHKRLLVIAAHPDDEDTALLTLVSRSMGGEAAYLSLSRGQRAPSTAAGSASPARTTSATRCRSRRRWDSGPKTSCSRARCG